MRAKEQKVKDEQVLKVEPEASPRLLKLLRGITPPKDGSVMVSSPALISYNEEEDREALLMSQDPEDAEQRKALAEQIRSLLRLNTHARSSGVDLAEAREKLNENARADLEKDWVSLLKNNVEAEQAARSVELFFSNLQEEGRTVMKGRVFAIPMGIKELATQAGQTFLNGYLKNYCDRPDSRKARSYILAPGWAGSAEAINRISKITHKNRSLLITDAPRYQTMDKLEADAQDGGKLERLPDDGKSVHKRHAILLGNWVKTRERLVGTYHAESGDFFMPASAVWFGLQLHNIVEGRPWMPVAGYMDPLTGAEGVELNLLVSEDDDGHALFTKHRINPIIPKAAGSDESVPWGAYSLGGAQIGEAITELIAARFFEHIVKKYALFNDLEEARDIVQLHMANFLVENSGAGRMFRSASNVKVTVDEKKKSLIVNAYLEYRVVAEKAIVRMMRMEHMRKAGTKPEMKVEDAS